MEIYVLDENFDILGKVPLYTSLIWTRRYYEEGIFELHADARYFSLFQSGKYVYRNDRDNLGLIENYNYSQGSDGRRTAFAKGHFAEQLLERRSIEMSVNLSGTPEAIGRSLVTKYCISPTDTNRKISHLALGQATGIGTSVRVQATGNRLGDKLYEVEKTQQQSHKLRYDYVENMMYFEVFAGKDRRESQDVNSWASFKNSFTNVLEASYEYNDTCYSNVAYVAGEGEGAARKVVEVDIRTSAEEERRELYVDARDLQQTYTDDGGTEHTYTDAEYEAILRQRGLEKLAECDIVENVQSSVDPNANLKYLVDFDLGDLCTYMDDDLGILVDARITEITETYEGTGMKLKVVFGEDETTSIKKLIKKEVS